MGALKAEVKPKVKERPILFNGEMVRAILDGRKTQTRRVMKPQPPSLEAVKATAGIEFSIGKCDAVGPGFHVFGPVWAVKEIMGCDYPQWTCPFGQPGDRLWVRETWSPDAADAYPFLKVVYRATEPEYSQLAIDCRWKAEVDEASKREHKCLDGCLCYFRWRPSIHMPRWASRITLEITGCRAERLQEISEVDAKAEGFGIDTEFCKSPPRVDFSSTWEKLYGLQSWIDNPWVWVVEFGRIKD